MELPAFLFIIILLLPIVLIACYNDRRHSRSPIFYFVVIALAMVLSYCTFTHYAKSHGDYYRNSDYHIIQQDGVKYPQGQTLYLASDAAPDTALLATGIGELWIDPNLNLHADGFRLPLYVEDSATSDYFQVVNASDELSIENGEELVVIRRWSKVDSLQIDTLLKIKYEEVVENGKIDRYRFVFSTMGTLHDTFRVYDTVYEPRFRQGLSLPNILQRGIKTRLNSSDIALFENCYLIRKNYKLDEQVNSKTPKESAPVYLFVDDKLNNDSCYFYVEKREVVPGRNSIEVVRMEGRQFYYGLGETKSEVYGIGVDNGDVFLKYRLPKMYHFPDFDTTGPTQMYLTTDINDIIKQSNEKEFKCFYQFSEQLTKGNIYKASAVLEINIDHSGVDFSPIYGDGYDDNQTMATPITIGKEFKVKTTSCGRNLGKAQVSYVFRIRDMRDNVVYRRTTLLYWIMLALFAVVFFMISRIASKSRDGYANKLYIVETSVYLVLIAFLTMRLVLLWRLHTFPPIDRVSYLEFNKLTDPSVFWYTFWLVIAVLVVRIGLLGFQWRTYRKRNVSLTNWIEGFFGWLESLGDKKYKPWWDKVRTIRIKDFRVPTLWVLAAVALPLVGYGICILLVGVEQFKVAAKEAVAPLVAFSINSIFLVMRKAEKKNKTERRNRGVYCWFAILLNTVMFFAFLLFVNELGMLFPMLPVFGVWFVVAAISSTDYVKDRILEKLVMGGFVVLALTLVFLHVPMEQKTWGKKVVSAAPIPSRIKARMETLAYTPTEMMQNKPVKFKETSLQEIRNASSNKWFIDNHLIQRNRLENENKGFILNKEYNQQAVSYEVQTRDVLLLRYIIFEHGRRVAVELILILLMLTINVFAVYKLREDNGKSLPILQHLPLQSAMYLLLFSIYLYLVNTNAVVFVGLDFPFLTLTSKVAPLGLLLPLLAMLLPVNMRQMDACFTPDFSSLDKRKIWAGIAPLILIGIFVIVPSRSMKETLNKQKDSTSYSISMEPMTEFINNFLNPRFKEYQSEKSEGKKLASRSIDDKKLKDQLKLFLGDYNDPNSEFESALADFNQKTKHKNRSDDFIRSAFEHLEQTSLTNTDNIIHIKKQNGQFVFVTNKVFYDMKPLFNNETENPWRGNLLAAASASRLTFMGEDGKKRNLKNVHDVFLFKDETANQEYLCDEKSNASFYLYQIPSKYCYNEDNDVFVMVCNKTADDKFKLTPKGDATSSFVEEYGVRVLPNDDIKVKKASKKFSLVTENGHYFAKRIHYNGKDQVIYPLGNKFMFAYNFDQMLADGYKTTSPTVPVRISLDYDLLTDVQGYCDSVIRTDNMLQRKGKKSLRYGEGITVTAVDGNGRIRLLADYNPRKMLTTDPNQSKEVKRIMDSIYLNGDNALERTLLQNRNIGRMPIGPGSTIKVPFYVALLAQVDLQWEKLDVGFPKDMYESVTSESGKSRDLVSAFGPDKLHRKHGLKNDKEGWDEMAGEYSKPASTGKGLTPVDFIATSNNFYYGSVLMLGSYDTDNLNQGLGKVLVPSSNNDKVFPMFMMDGKYYKFASNYLKDLSDRQNFYALETGLTEKFRFNNSRKTDNMIRFYDKQPVEHLLGLNAGDGYNSMNALYVYSILPSYYNYIKQRSMEHKQDIYNDHLNITAGGVQKMDVTPLSMAEMYLRVALQNGYKGSLLTYQDDAEVCPKDSLSTIKGFQNRMKSTVYKGMWNVIRQGGLLHGTLINCVSKDLLERLKREHIYLYGKTGTAGTLSQANNNYHYAFILSNKNLHDNDYDPQNLKIYVVYFGYYNGTLGHSGTTQTRDEILLKIIESETFKNYWYDSNNNEN